MLIDAHQHFWQVGRFDYPWMSPDIEVLYQDYLPSQLEPVLNQNCIVQSMLVQASNSYDETYWLLSLAESHPIVAGVVGWVNLEDPEMERELETLAANPKFKGVRHLVESETNDDWLVQASVLNGLRVLEKHGVSYDLLVHTRHLKHVKTIAEACPNLSLVIDHMAKPPIASREITPWADALNEVAAYPNVSCKLSGLVTEANWSSWTIEDLRPYVARALEFFGPKRMMFGSDWPVCLLAASYNRVLESFQLLLADLPEEDRNRIFGGNAIEFYKLGVAGAVAQVEPSFHAERSH
ncbi:MAG TPA: amidohydrolase family protein [Pyrinomonadaceae bacterium]|nr:amidohydrolase family protein [Pyrinomonadaceae bacterium]